MLRPAFPNFESYDGFERLDDLPVLFKDGFLHVSDDVFTALANRAATRVSFYLRARHLQALRAVFDDSAASENDKFSAWCFLKNACVAAKGELPLCQDTGTAVVFGEKGHRVLTSGDDAAALSAGIGQAYAQNNLRYSQNAAQTFFTEKNTRTNLPAAIELSAVKGDEYRFLFMAKGGGSANKTFLFQQTRALLDKDALCAFLKEKIAAIGTSACPPYHLCVVVGGLTAEDCLKTVKLASAGALDGLPASSDGSGSPFRDLQMEELICKIANDTGLGAQFGGRHFCLDARCVRLARHGASLPVGIGVACVADRNILARVTKDGVFLEKLEEHPERFLPDVKAGASFDGAREIDLDISMTHTLQTLSRKKIGEKVLLTGTLIVARDQAHARFKKMFEEGTPLPDYLKKYPVYYAGPAKTPAGLPCGSLGPTTSGRMDSYADFLQSKGASLVSLGKGVRAHGVVEACQKYGGFYLGTLGGAAALTTSEYIKSCECVDFDDLGMEAVYRLRVEKFPAVVLIDDKGGDFYFSLLR